MRNKSIVILIILLFINPVNFMTTVANDEEVEAILGENQGSLVSVSTESWFIFKGNNESVYRFVLDFPYGTIFNFELIDPYGVIILKTDFDSSLSAGSITKMPKAFGYDEYHIRIFSDEGIGNFTLTIILLEINKLQFADSMEYMGYTWDVNDEGGVSKFNGLHDGDRIRLEFLENVGQYWYYDNMDLYELINLEINNEAIMDDELRWELFQFLLIPITAILTDSTACDMEEMLEEGWIDRYPRGERWGEHEKVIGMHYGDIIDSKDHHYWVYYDKYTGILESYKFEISEVGNVHEYDARFSIYRTSVYHINVEGNGNGLFADDTSVNLLWFLIGLVAIPVLMRKSQI